MHVTNGKTTVVSGTQTMDEKKARKTRLFLPLYPRPDCTGFLPCFFFLTVRTIFISAAADCEPPPAGWPGQ
jgi:hypothetical protein